MSLPRQVLPGTTYLVTRRCSERRFFLRPHHVTNAVFLYILALAAERHGILLHAFVVLSNHYHLVLTDTQGRLPLFQHDLNLLLARALNTRLARFESFWAAGSYSAVVLPDAGAVLDKLAYTLANPVSAGLVAHSVQWPGAISTPESIGAEPRIISRPAIFFRQGGEAALPEKVCLLLSVPPALAHLPIEEIRTLVKQLLAEREERARLERGGRPFLGAKRVLKQRISDRPSEEEAPFRLKPTVAGSTRSTRNRALAQLRAFVDAYRTAWRRFKQGMRDAVFPAGTWKLRRELGVLCETPS